jgi:hypothetical protein
LIAVILRRRYNQAEEAVITCIHLLSKQRTKALRRRKQKQRFSSLIASQVAYKGTNGRQGKYINSIHAVGSCPLLWMRKNRKSANLLPATPKSANKCQKSDCVHSTVTTIEPSPFSSCVTLTTIVLLPKGVTTIGDHAFRGCTSLTSIEIPDGATNIGNCTFWGCTSLASIVIPEVLSTIGRDAFRARELLASIVIPERSVATIGFAAFREFKSLVSISIPKGLTTIFDDAFWEGTSLTLIVIP